MDELMDFMRRCDEQLARDPQDVETWCARCWAQDLVLKKQKASRGDAPAAVCEA
jgi:hypothetical protein